MSRSRSTRLLLLALALAMLLTAPRAANAGTYTVKACSPTSSTGAWQPLDTFPEGLLAGNACGGSELGPITSQGPTDTGALFAEDALGSPAHIPNGAEAGWSFSAPPGMTITGLSYYRTLHAYLEPDLLPGLWTSEGTAVESCQSPREGTHECNSLNNQVPVSFPVLHTGSLFFGLRCNLIDGVTVQVWQVAVGMARMLLCVCGSAVV